MAKIPKVAPAWVSPLTDEQHAQLGRLCVLWGQIDLLLDQILKWSYGLRKSQWDALKLHERPFGAKLELLKASLPGVGDITILEDLKLFCAELDNVKGPRNHAVHGIWGWRIESGGKMVACARHQKSPSTPLKPSQFAALEKSLCYCSNIGVRVFMAAMNRPMPETITSGRFFHGSEDPPPEFLALWQDKYPWDDAIQDRNCKEGQLPRPWQPLPEM